MGQLCKNAAVFAALTLLCVPMCACGSSHTDAFYAPAPAVSVSAATVPQADIWDGDLAAAGWGDTEDSKAAAPAKYKLNTTAKTLEIGSADAFAYFSHQVFVGAENGFTGYNVSLECDIDLNDKLWIPIGFTYRGNAANYDKAFKGEFDGENHTVYNFNGTSFLKAVTKVESNYYVDIGNDKPIEFPLKSGEEFHYGLFGVICGTSDGETDYVATVKNLTIDHFEFDFGADGVVDALPLQADVAAFVGFSNNSILLENCKTGGGFIKGAKKYADDLGRIELGGGIAARSYIGDGSIKNNSAVRRFVNCENNVDVDLDDGNVLQRAVGICAYYSGGGTFEFTDCINNGDMTGAIVGGYMSFTQSAGNLTFDNCVNNGNITSTCGGSTYGSAAGGLAANLNGNIVIKNSTNNGKIASSAGEGVISRVGGLLGGTTNSYLTIENCVNNGDIINHSNGTAYTHEIGGTGSNTGGLVGAAGLFYANSGSSIKSSVNYGKILYTQSVENLDVMYADGIIARVSGGNATAENKFSYNDAVVSIYTPQLLDENNDGNTADIMPTAEENIIALTADNGLILEDNGATLAGIDNSIDNGSYKVIVPATVTKIKTQAFLGLGTHRAPSMSVPTWFESVQTKFVTEVDFSLAVDLVEIGDMAFAGTDITSVAIPDSVTTIGVGAFAQTKLVSAVIPAGVKNVGDAAFGNISTLKQVRLTQDGIEFGDGVFNGAASDAFVIAPDKESYIDEDFSEMLTYAVTVEYYNYYTNSVADTELKLHGKTYAMICTDGVWSLGNIEYVGTTATNAEQTVWYSDAECTNALDSVDEATQFIANSASDVIRFYTRNTGNSERFIARTDLVYNGVEYSALSINALLSANSKKVTDETVSFKKGGEAVNVICDAGVYTVTIGEEEIEVVVAKAEIDLASATNLVWRVNGNITMLDRTIYLYDKGETKYPSLSALEDGKVEGVDVSTEQVKTVIDSVVRARGNSVLTLGLLDGNGFTVTAASHTASGVGMYTSVFTLAADANHELVQNGTLTNAAARGLTVAQGAGGTYTVTKVWYVVEMDNWFVDGNGADYVINDRVYGDGARITAPNLANGSEALAADTLTFTLVYNNTAMPDFHAADFEKYLNNMMPAGSYTLIMSAKEFDYEVVDEEDPTGLDTITLHSAAFTQSVAFNVATIGMDSIAKNQFDKIADALNGKTFEFIVGSAEMSAGNNAVKTAVDTAIEEIKRAMPASSVTGNVWTGSDYVGAPLLGFNPADAMINSYAETFVKPTAAGVYTYYYRVTARNYADVAADVDGKLFSFTVAAFEYVDVPVAADLAKTYTGEKLTADVVGTDKYTVLENDGGINVGTYDVVFELIHPDYTLWKGETLADKASTYTVDFAIEKATNVWIEAPDIVRWVEGEYSVDENTFIGAAKFGTIEYVVTDADGNVYYDSSNDINKLASLKAGTYNLRATIAGNDNYNGLSEAFTIKVLEKEGLPWWAILLIVIGSLGVAALILWILHEKGVLQMLTGKVVIAIRTKMTVDATIAAVRANKRAEESRKSIAKAEAADKAEERRKAREEELAKPPAERAAALEEQAAALEEQAAKRSEQAAKRAARLKQQAEKLKSSEQTATTDVPETPDEQ